MSDRDDKLTADTFAPAGGQSNEALAATTFEPLSQATSEKRQVSAAQIAAGIAGVFIVALLFFLFTARSLTLNIVAEADPDFSLSGLNWSFGERILVRPGQYVLKVAAEGYHPYEQNITVSDADTQQLEIQLAPLPGTVTLTTQPAGAVITVDEAVLGPSPLTDRVLEAGRYAVSASLARYQRWQGELDVIGRNQSQTLDIMMVPDWAQVTFTTTPVSVTATVDGEVSEITERGVEVLSGERSLTLSAPGFMPATIPLNIVAGVDQDLGTITLTPADATLTLNSTPAGAGVSVDGTFAGLTPMVLPLSPGENHTISLSKAGYRGARLSLSLSRGEMAERAVTLQPELGEVRFAIEPAEAEIVVNGKVMGTGSRVLSLPAVQQRIEVRLAGYAGFETQVLPKPGLAQQVSVTLLTKAAARKAAMTPTVTTGLGNTLVLIDPSVETQNPFTMGASRRDPGRRANEVEHPVELQRAFYIASTETTNAQFRQFEASHDSGLIESYSLDRDQQPVAGISWQQAASFCNWLSRREGLPPFYRENQGIVIGFNPGSTGYRLPSEAEWAFAARVEGETLRRFAWGDDFPPSAVVTNVADNTSALVTGRILNGYTDQFVVSAPVGSFPPNHRGLHDMGGNVAEWVHDGYQIPSANAELSIDPLGSQRGDNYTIRGGSWALSRLSELRLTFRDYGERGRDDLGFRIARYAE
ncbi:MAG: SUMF1/EgtB/PvdO family nonheme iron enzyme [Proteobacteria bacterium]|nr:SUMF1/EgtB/PvdO family nonheme iron enzyme [Luminiphilus sp.]MDA0649777.1 SUMF1/EgtB/PvdO family nonheme iron enzyme [Pseudomonadota bacterium]